MTWLLPSALGIAGAAAIIAVALHFIARSRPLAEPLPTARFIPERPVHARARAISLTDVPLLLVRLAAVIAIGLAVAGPMFATRGHVARIVVADHSRSVANVAEVRDSAKVYLGTRDQLVMFDSLAHAATGPSALDSLSASAARGSLSAGLATAAATAARGLPPADSIELVLVSPLSEEEVDEATTRIRAAWPGRIRVVPVRAANASIPATRVEVSATANDAVDAGLALLGVKSSPGSVRVVRRRLTPEDSVWARGDGHILVHWPAGAADADWPPRQTIDAIGGVTSATATLVARFPRVWVLQQGTAIARWADGEPAVVEHEVGTGCIRDVSVLIDQASDVTLRVPFQRFVQGLLVPCGGARVTQRVSAATVAAFAGGPGLAAADALRDPAAVSSPWTLWLLVLGALLLVAELALRRSPSRSRTA